MKISFYPTLAWDGIRKNKRLYLPYILTGTIMTMMYYILSTLSESSTLSQMSGGDTLMFLLPLGAAVIAIFSLLFLFYTNSFLIRQRYREFGLYHVLGMDKRNINKIMFWEGLMVGACAIASGLILGIALSKTAELVLLNLLNKEISYELRIGIGAISKTTLVFGILYVILLINSFIRVKCTKPLELMKSNRVGEKLPKRIWIYAVIGILLLGTAYFLSIRIKEPLAALFLFFIAVILVILGTYALFIAGSVVFCRLLQKNKRYYYKPNHFVSVSSMVYRMRRNGAGLASICILLTMVLVMISSTASLYFGAEDALFRRYPHDVNLTVHFQSMEDMRDEKTDTLKQELIAVCGEALAADSPYLVVVPGLITEEGLIFDYGAYDDFSLTTYNDLGYLSVLSLEDYNLISDSVEVLEDDACILFHSETNFASDTFTLENGMPYQVQKVLDSFPGTENTTALVLPQIFIVVKDPTAFLEPVRTVENRWGKTLLTYKWNGGFDFSSPQEALASEHAIREALHRLQAEGTHGILSYQVDSREFHRNDFFGTFGSLFFLGIMLSIVFLLAAVLIIYYKQISEGYEDQSRFEIMQKVGMTKKDIRKSINSQMLTVFFLPLLFAGIHLCFAFPFLWRILTLFALNNMLFVIVVMLICFAIFGLFYTLVYKITAGAYYAIVSG